MCRHLGTAATAAAPIDSPILEDVVICFQFNAGRDPSGLAGSVPKNYALNCKGGNDSVVYVEARLTGLWTQELSLEQLKGKILTFRNSFTSIPPAGNISITQRIRKGIIAASAYRLCKRLKLPGYDSAPKPCSLPVRHREAAGESDPSVYNAHIGFRTQKRALGRLMSNRSKEREAC